MFRFVFVIVLLFSTVAGAVELDKEQYDLMVGYLTQKYELQANVKGIAEGSIENRKLQIIFYILKNTNEVYIHQQRGQRGNKVFLGPDGHREAVFDADGKPVKDGINDASYNYFHPQEEPLRHFLADMHPWILLGNSRQDPTSIDERLSAYVSDLEGGLRRAHSHRKEFKNVPVSEPGQKEVLAFFLKVIEVGNAESVYVLFEKETLADEDVLQSLRAIHAGLLEICGKKP